MLVRPTVLAALALLAAGCGGSDPDEAVRGYFEAIVDRDGQRACDELSAELRREVERAPAAREAGRTCADVMNLAVGLNPGLRKQDVEELDIEVETNGDRAVAKLENPLVRRRETIRLVKEDGDWKISTLATRPQG